MSTRSGTMISATSRRIVLSPGPGTENVPDVVINLKGKSRTGKDPYDLKRICRNRGWR